MKDQIAKWVREHRRTVVAIGVAAALVCLFVAAGQC